MNAAEQIDFDILTFITQSGFSVISLSVVFFIVLTLSSFVKIVTVLGILRAGLGFQSIPSSFVTGSLAFALALFVMFPTLQVSTAAFDAMIGRGQAKSPEILRTQATAAAFEKWKEFLIRHAHPVEKQRFLKIASELDAQTRVSETGAATSAESIRVLAPAFLVSELKEAFATGLIVFLPLLVVELVVANVLVAVGLTQLSPALVSLPFKLLLFVLVDGWGLITGNLLMSYGK